MVQQLCNRSGCYPCFQGVFLRTAGSERLSKQHKFPSPSDQPELFAAYTEDNGMWIPNTNALCITASVRATSLPGSLSHSEEDTDEESSLWISDMKSYRNIRKKTQRDHLEELQEFQRSVELQPRKLTKLILSSRVAMDKQAEAEEAKGKSALTQIESLLESMPTVPRMPLNPQKCGTGSSVGHLSQ